MYVTFFITQKSTREQAKVFLRNIKFPMKMCAMGEEMAKTLNNKKYNNDNNNNNEK